MMMNAEAALFASAMIAGIGVSVSALEDLVTWRSFGDQGLLSWEVNQLESRWSALGFPASIASCFLSPRPFLVLLLARLVSAVVVVVLVPLGVLNSTLLALVFLSTASLSIRSRYGLDGAHQMWLVIFGTLFLASLVPVGDKARVAALWFLAAQGGLSYLVAGAYKTASRVWWDGTGLSGVLGTSTYGKTWAYRLLSGRPLLARLLSWGVIVFECGFVLVFFVDHTYAAVILGLGFIFHTAIAAIMGLNDFLFAFPATYPAIIYCAWGGGTQEFGKIIHGF